MHPIDTGGGQVDGGGPSTKNEEKLSIGDYHDNEIQQDFSDNVIKNSLDLTQRYRVM